MKKYIFYLLFVFLAFNSLGQGKCKIRGAVTYKDEPLPGIIVLIEKDGLSSGEMLTDFNGEYCFVVEHGIYNIRVLDISFLKDSIIVNATDGDEIIVADYRLQEMPEKRYNVVEITDTVTFSAIEIKKINKQYKSVISHLLKETKKEIGVPDKTQFVIKIDMCNGFSTDRPDIDIEGYKSAISDYIKANKVLIEQRSGTIKNFYAFMTEGKYSTGSCEHKDKTNEGGYWAGITIVKKDGASMKYFYSERQHPTFFHSRYKGHDVFFVHITGKSRINENEYKQYKYPIKYETLEEAENGKLSQEDYYSWSDYKTEDYEIPVVVYISQQFCDYAFKGSLIESYYNAYYEYPKTLADFMSFCDAQGLKKYSPKTIRKERNNICWNLDSEKLIVTSNNDTIYEVETRNPCDELDYNRRFYDRILFYDKEGVRINSEKLDSVFLKGVKENMDSKILSEKEYGGFILLKYTPETGLVPFCENDSLDGINKYYDTMNSFLENFVKEKHLGKVVFALQRFE